MTSTPAAILRFDRDRVITGTLSLQIEVAEDIAKAVTDALSATRRASA